MWCHWYKGCEVQFKADGVDVGKFASKGKKRNRGQTCPTTTFGWSLA